MRKIKKVLLALGMAAGLAALSACSAPAEDETKPLDLTLSSTISMASEAVLQQVTAATEADVDQLIADSEEADSAFAVEAYTTWKNVMSDTGSYVKVESSDVSLVDDEYVCEMVAQFENRLVDCSIYYDKNTSAATSISISPRYTTGERLSKAGMNTLIGMGTVFIVLIFISLLISCFKYINQWEKKMAEKHAPASPAPAPVPAAPAVPEEEELTDDLELVAVITAAIAASTGASADGLVVRSIRRAPASKWKRV